MQSLNPKVSALTILNRYSAYLLAQLRANPLLQSVTEAAQRNSDALSSALQAFWTAEKEKMAAASARATAEYRLDAAIRTVRTAVLVVALNDARSQVYQAVFPDGMARVIRSNPQDKLSLARRILQSLAEFVAPALPTETANLQAAVIAFESAVAACDAAQKAEDAAAGALQTSKVSYCNRYGEIFHQLVVTLGERRQAEMYFRQVRGSAPPAPSPTPQAVPSPQPAIAPEPTAAGTKEPTPSSAAPTSPNLAIVAAREPEPAAHAEVSPVREVTAAAA